MQKMARRHDKEGGNHLDQESNRQKAMEETDGGLHPTVDGQSEGEVKWLSCQTSDVLMSVIRLAGCCQYGGGVFNLRISI